MKTLLPAFILTCSLLSGCHNGKKVEAENISATKTAQHVNIPGTRLFIIPPEGFTLDRNMKGFVKLLNGHVAGQIQFRDSIDKVYQPIIKAPPDSKDIKVNAFGNINVNGYAGQYLETEARPLVTSDTTMMLMTGMTGSEIFLSFGDYSFTAYVSTSVPDGDSSLNAILRKAIKTVYYDKGKKISPYEMALFSIDDSKSRFKLTKVMMSGTAFVYTIDGVDKDSYTVRKDNAFTITELMGDYNGISEMTQNLATKLKDAGATNIKVSKPVADKTDEATIEESEIQFQMEQDKILIYLAIADNGTYKIQFQGSVHSDLEESKQDFKTLTRSISFND